MSVMELRRASVAALLICVSSSAAALAQQKDEGPTNWQKLDDAAFVRWMSGEEWKSFDSYHFYPQVQMARRLRQIGEPAAAARQGVARHVWSLAEKPGLSPERWGQFSAILSDDLDDAAKASWRAKIREAYIVDASRLAKLELDDIQRLASAVAALEDPDVNGLSATWVNGSENWKKLSTGQLQWVTARLKGGQAAAAAKGRVIEHVEGKYLTDKATANRIGPRGLYHVTLNVADAMSPATRARWAKKLDDYFFDSPKKGWKLTAMFKKLGAGDRIRLFSVRIVTETEGWKQGTPAELRDLLVGVANAGREGREAIPRVAGHIEAAYLKDVESTRAVSLELWGEYAEYLAGQLSDEQKAKWASAVRAAYGQEEGRAARQLASVMATLGARESAERFRAEWVLESDEWKRYSADDLADLVLRLAKAGESAKAARAAVAAHVADRYLSDADEARSVGLDWWSQLAEAMKGELTAEDRALWVTRLRAAFVGNGSRLKDVKRDRFNILVRTVRALGDADAGSLESAWVANGGLWQSLSNYDQSRLAGRLREMGQGGDAGRATMRQTFEQQYLADPAKARQLSPEQWRGLALPLLSDRPASEKQAWAKKIRGAFTESAAALDGMRDRDVMILVSLLEKLGDATAPTVWIAYVEQGASWKETGTTTLSSRAGILADLGAPAKAARSRMIEYLTVTHLADKAAARKVGMATWNAFVAQLAGDMNEQTRALWAVKLQDAFADGKGMTQAKLLWALKRLQRAG